MRALFGSLVLLGIAAATTGANRAAGDMPMEPPHRMGPHHGGHHHRRHDQDGHVVARHMGHVRHLDEDQMPAGRPLRLHRHHGVSGLDASVTVLLHSSLFNKIVASVLPAVIADARKLEIPGQHEKHFSFNTIRLSEFNIGSFTIGFAAPDKVVITLTDLSLAVPDTHFDVFTKILFFKASCGGDFDVAVSRTNIRIEFDLTEHDGHLAISDGVASVSFGDLDVHHFFGNFFCKVGQDIIQAFVGNIDDLIRNLVEKDISPAITKALNAAFAKMAGKIAIPLVAAPKATSDSIQIDLNLLPPQPHQERRLAAVPDVQSDFPGRDIEAFISQGSIDALFQHFFDIGHLNHVQQLSVTTSVLKSLLPAAYNMCPDCPLEIGFKFNEAPTGTFDHSATVGVRKMDLALAARNKTTSDSIQFVDLSLNGTFSALNWTISGEHSNVIDFKIALPVFTVSLIKSEVGPVDASLLQDIVDFVMRDVAIPAFNKDFHGLPIGPIADIQIEDVAIGFPSAVDVGMDIQVPKL